MRRCPNLSVAIGEVQRFVAGTPEPDRRADSAAGQRHPGPRRQPPGVRERPAHHAQRDRQLQQHLLPERRLGDRGVLARQLLQSGAGRLRHDRRRREHHRARNRETLRAVPRSGVAAAELQRACRFRSTPYLRPAINPDRIDLHRPEAGAGRRRARATRRSRRRRCPPTPARATSRRRRAGTDRRTACRGVYAPRSATSAARFRRTALITDAPPLESAAHHLEHSGAGADRRRDAAPADRGRPPGHRRTRMHPCCLRKGRRHHDSPESKRVGRRRRRASR